MNETRGAGSIENGLKHLVDTRPNDFERASFRGRRSSKIRCAALLASNCRSDCGSTISRSWSAPTAKPGWPCLRSANGKVLYAPVLEWRDRDLADRFSEAVVELIQREHPDALGGKGVVS